MTQLGLSAHLNSNVMGLRPLYFFFNSFSAETVFRRQNLASKDGTRVRRVNIVAQLSPRTLLTL